MILNVIEHFVNERQQITWSS